MKSNHILYYCLSSIGFFLSLLGFILPKIVAILVPMFIWASFHQSFWVSLISVITFFVTPSLFYPVGKYIVGKGLMLSDHSRRYAFSYINKYGQNYKYPNLSDYNLEAKEYHAYNKRFKIDSQSFSFVSIPIVFILLITQTQLKGLVVGFIFFIIAISFSLILKFILKMIDLHSSKKWRQHNAVLEFKHALQIYEKIQEEIKANKNSFTGWGK